MFSRFLVWGTYRRWVIISTQTTSPYYSVLCCCFLVFSNFECGTPTSRHVYTTTVYNICYALDRHITLSLSMFLPTLFTIICCCCAFLCATGKLPVYVSVDACKYFVLENSLFYFSIDPKTEHYEQMQLLPLSNQRSDCAQNHENIIGCWFCCWWCLWLMFNALSKYRNWYFITDFLVCTSARMQALANDYKQVLQFTMKS